MPEHTAIHTQNGEQQLQQEPDDDVDGLRPLEQLLPILYAQKGLGHHYSAVHPTLGAHSLTLSICDVAVVLPATHINSLLIEKGLCECRNYQLCFRMYICAFHPDTSSFLASLPLFNPIFV